MQWACRGDRKGKTPELKPQHLSMAPLGKLYRVPGAYCDRHRCSDRLQERRLLIAPTNQTAKILKSGLLEIVFIKDNESSLCCQRGTRDLRKQCSVRLEGRKETNDVKKKTEPPCSHPVLTQARRSSQDTTTGMQRWCASGMALASYVSEV